MALTAHFFAGDTDKLWTTANSGGYGVHTGTPSNGSLIAVWQDEATPATRDRCLFVASGGQPPSWSSPGSMLLPSVVFDGTDDFQQLATNVGGYRVFSDVLSVSAKTIVGSFRMTVTATNNASIYQNSALFCDISAYFGLHFKSSGGVHSVYAYNWDSNADITTAINISLDTDYVFLYRHDGTTLYLSILSGNGGGTRVDQSVSSGATHANVVGRRINVGRSYQAYYYTGAIGELYFDNTDLGSTNTPLTDIVGRWLPSAAPQAGNMMLMF